MTCRRDSGNHQKRSALAALAAYPHHTALYDARDCSGPGVSSDGMRHPELSYLAFASRRGLGPRFGGSTLRWSGRSLGPPCACHNPQSSIREQKANTYPSVPQDLITPAGEQQFNRPSHRFATPNDLSPSLRPDSATACFSGASAPPHASGITWSITNPGQAPVLEPVDGHGCSRLNPARAAGER
jgi:hypothetical protein